MMLKWQPHLGYLKSNTHGVDKGKNDREIVNEALAFVNYWLYAFCTIFPNYDRNGSTDFLFFLYALSHPTAPPQPAHCFPPPVQRSVLVATETSNGKGNHDIHGLKTHSNCLSQCWVVLLLQEGMVTP